MNYNSYSTAYLKMPGQREKSLHSTPLEIKVHYFITIHSFIVHQLWNSLPSEIRQAESFSVCS